MTVKSLIDPRSLQAAMKSAGYYTGAIDGAFGAKSKTARDKWVANMIGAKSASWPDERRQVALNQIVLKTAGMTVGTVDGLIGPQTLYALEQWQNRSRDVDPAPELIADQPTVFPRYSEIEKFYGKPGTGLVMMTCPYPVRIAWDKTKTISKFQIHGKCKDSAETAMETVLEHYGMDEISRLGLDLWGGCYSNRPMRGGSRPSTHAYAAAIDWDPERNQLRWGADRAVMDDPERKAFVDAWEAQGWVSLGRARNFDWMHMQACRL